MTNKDLEKALALKALTSIDAENEVEGCYVGDLLSWVMGRANEKEAWITVMGNVNAVAVAKLVDISCIILCEDAHLDDEAKQRAEENGIPIYSSGETAYRLAVRAGKLLGEIE